MPGTTQTKCSIGEELLSDCGWREKKTKLQTFFPSKAPLSENVTAARASLWDVRLAESILILLDQSSQEAVRISGDQIQRVNSLRLGSSQGINEGGTLGSRSQQQTSSRNDYSSWMCCLDPGQSAVKDLGDFCLHSWCCAFAVCLDWPAVPVT